jgi:hypothetical protein
LDFDTGPHMAPHEENAVFDLDRAAAINVWRAMRAEAPAHRQITLYGPSGVRVREGRGLVKTG